MNLLSTKTVHLLLFILTILLYINTLNHGYVLDDYTVITENFVTQKGIAGIPEIVSHFYRYGHAAMGDGLYRPLSVILFAIEWQISPNNPTIHHFVNILFYVLTIQVVFIFLRTILPKYSLILPLSITLLFATHPTHTEVVANIKSRDELLAFFFSILALLYGINYVKSKINKKMWMCCLFYLLALLSKETAILILLILPITLYFFTDNSWKTYRKPVVYLSIISILFLLLRHVVLENHGTSYAIAKLENPLVDLSLVERLPTAFSLVGHYVFLVFVPYKLLYDYSFNQIPIIHYTHIYFWLSFTMIVLLFTYTIYRFQKKEVIIYGILFFGITISLFSNLPLKIGSIFSIRFLYFPSFGFCFVLPFLFDRIFGARKMLYVILTICCFFSIKTISRNSDWKENYSLFLSDSKNLKNNAKAHLFLGIEYLKKGQTITTDNKIKTDVIKKGIHELTWSYRMYPNSIENLENLGNAYQMLHQNDSAIYYFNKVQKLDSKSCNGNLGDIYFDIKDFKSAIQFYKKEINVHPKAVRGYHNLGMTLASIGAYHRAIMYLNKGILVAPKNIEIKLLLAQVYKAMGDEVNFIKYYSLANNIQQ